MDQMTEEIALKGYRFPAFGGEVTVEASGPEAESLLRAGAARVTEISQTLTRFDPDSELSRINADPRGTVEASPLMIRFVEAATEAAGLTGGLVDPTLLPELESAGYSRSMSGNGTDHWTPGIAGAESDTKADASGPAMGDRWGTISVDSKKGTLNRGTGVRLDAGGIGKGLASDLVAELMEDSKVEAWSVDCLGDVRIGGSAGQVRPVTIGSPFPNGDPIEVLEIRNAGIATSGTTRRTWTNSDGTSAHHLIDPRTGLPAEGDLVQVTAIAPTTVEAEARAKAALLSGLDQVERWLPHGGLIIDMDGQVHRFGYLQEVV